MTLRSLRKQILAWYEAIISTWYTTSSSYSTSGTLSSVSAALVGPNGVPAGEV